MDNRIIEITKTSKDMKTKTLKQIREQEREAAEGRHKAGLLAEGREKLLANEFITTEQLELLAEAVGYVIHGRTLGFMREKVYEVRWAADRSVTIRGRRLTDRNTSGTEYVVRRIIDRLKEQAEAEAQEAATAAETPQISTEAVETVECAAEDEMPHDAVYMEPYNIKYFVDKHGDLETLDRDYKTAVQLKDSMLDEYRTDSRKGGRFRKQRMARLVNEINALKQEHEDIRRAIFISMCIKHRKEYATNHSHYSLYRYNDDVYAFGKEVELIREYFIGNKYVPLERVEHTFNGETYFKFHYSVYNGDLSGRVCHLLRQKHISEYGKPANGLIVLWHAEEVEYWSKYNPSQPPETPPKVNYTTPTAERSHNVNKQPNTAYLTKTA